MMDEELLNDLLTEMKMLGAELLPIVRSLQGDPNQPAMFEKFGQIIDRIYGTAATFGLKELASYCGTLKKICYECAKMNNARANAKVLKLLETYLGNLVTLIKGVKDPEVAKKIYHGIHIEEQKAKKIQEDIFQFIKK